MQPALMDFKSGKWLTGSLAPLAKMLASNEITKEEYAAKYDLAMSTIPSRRPTGAAHPLTLKDFGYFYNEKGELRTIKDPESGFIWLGQKHYDYLGEVIVEHIYGVLEGPEFDLQRRMVPLKKNAGTKSRSLSPKRPREEDGGDAATSTAMEATSNEVGDIVTPLAPPSPTTVPPLAEEAAEEDVSIPIFVSANLDKYESIMLLSQGSGAVRPGMWARALCVNNSLEAGSIFTYLREAKARNWGIVVTNPNENTGFEGVRSVHSNLTLWGDNTHQVMDPKVAAATQKSGDAAVSLSEAYWLGTPDSDWKKYSSFVMRKHATPVPHSDTPPAHTVHVYNNLILPSPAKQVFIVAHSYGGVCTGGLLRDPASFPDLQKRCPAIAFTDAINTITKRDQKAVRQFNKDRVINWVAAPRPLDTPCGTDLDGGNEERSAGHTAHEWTSASCCSSVFKYFDDAASGGFSN